MILTPLISHMVQWQPLFSVALKLMVAKGYLLRSEAGKVHVFILWCSWFILQWHRELNLWDMNHFW